MPTHISFNLDSITPIQAKALGAMLKVFEDEMQPTALRGMLSVAAPAIPGNFRDKEIPCQDYGSDFAEVTRKALEASEAAMVAGAQASAKHDFEPESEPEPRRGIPVDMDEKEAAKEKSRRTRRTRRTKAEMEAAKGPSPDETTFNGFLAIINDQMDAAHIDTDKRRNAVKEWEARFATDGAQAIEDIQKAIGLNKYFLAKKGQVAVAQVDPSKSGATNTTKIQENGKEAGSTNSEVKGPTLDELRTIMNGYTTRHDFDMTLALLAKYKCARANNVLDMPLTEQLKFVEEANA